MTEQPQPSDFALVQAFLGGSESAFKELVSRHQVRLYAFVRRQVRDHAETSDICQKVFLQVFLKAKGFRGESEFRTWLYQIAVNLCKNHIRSLARTPVEITDPDSFIGEDPGVETTTQSIRSSVALRAAVDALPPKQRLVLQLRFYQDCTFDEMAKIMKCPLGTAKANYHHAVTNLRRVLRDKET